MKRPPIVRCEALAAKLERECYEAGMRSIALGFAVEHLTARLPAQGPGDGDDPKPAPQMPGPWGQS